MAELDRTRKQIHDDHLARVRALSGEVQTAIGALEKNDFALLEQSVARQEALCSEIVSLKAESRVPDVNSAAETRHAYMALAQKNRVCAALLKRSDRTVGLLSGLYRCYGSGLEKKSTDHTWSCEV
jgi:hypothetical protein